MVLVGWKLTSLYLALLFLALILVILVAVLFELKSASFCRVLSETLLTKHVDGFHVYGIRGGSCGCLRRMWKSQMPLRIHCGQEFVIGQDAVMNYLDVLTNNAANLVVIIKI